MKIIAKRIVTYILFLIILALTAGFFFRAFTPDDGNYVLPRDFYRKDKDRFDVLFLGTSKIKQGVFPMTLYNEYGISSYNLGTGDQTAALSYYVLKDAIERQHPKMVVLEVGMGDYQTTYEGTEDLHYITDNMPFFAKSRYEMIRGVGKEDDDLIRFLFPWYEYHSRWTNLTEEEVVHEDSGAAYGSWILAQGRDSGYFEPVAPDTAYELPEIVTEYMEKTVQLCEETGTKLVFLTLPVFGPGLLTDNLYPQRINESYAVERFANAHHLSCLNLIDKTTSLGLDCTTDTLDGMHLNLSGAEKFSAVLGKELKGLCDLPDRREEQGYEFLEKDYESYLHFRARQSLATDNRTASYFARMLETYDTDNYLYVFVASGDTTPSMTDTVKASLKALGLANVDSAAGDHAYIAVIDRGNVVYETSDFSLTSDLYEEKVDGVSVLALSRSAEEGSGSQIIVDLNNYDLQGPGLNIVVFDRETGKKVDASYVAGDEVLHKYGEE